MHRRLLFVLTIALAASPLMASSAGASTTAGFSGAGVGAGAGAPNGYFVVSDLSANVGASVEFWGAQWSKDNSMSGGHGPAAFKGFADSVDHPSCPTRWTTDPGNSAPPPATVSADITVIVSSSIDKSGPVISGNVVRIVTVHTDPGYQGDPGHAGTGTVTSVVSCGPSPI